jgi:subtilisin family serine protease
MSISTLIGSISVEFVFSQSVEQDTLEGKNIISQNPIRDIVSEQPNQILNNSFIIELKPMKVGTLEDTVYKLTSNITSYDGNVSGIYDGSNSFNIKFEENDNVSGLERAGDGSLSKAKQFLQKLKDYPIFANVYPDAKVTTQAQILPNDQNRVDVDLSSAKSGDGTGTINASIESDAMTNTQAQILPNDQNRVDADLSSAKSGDGTGTVNASIAILDTGVQKDHPDLNVYKCFSFIGNPFSGTPLDTCDDRNGAGTHAAGTAAAIDNNIGIVGKAPGAKIWAIKVFDDTGSATFSDILEALYYIYSHANEIDVVNLNIGGPGTFPPVEYAITNLVNKGIVVVVGAGWHNMDANNWTPARTPAAITVSAISDSDGKCGRDGRATTHGGSDDSFATYSNHGSVVDIAAPGTDVLSTYINSSYTRMSGTAMAASNVAGAAALYISMNPSATPDQVDTALKSSGTKAPQSGNGLEPCDGNGKGYFTYSNDDDQFREPLLYMKEQK